MTSEVRYARSGELSIAYQAYGEGDLDIVYVPGFVSHAELEWEIPFFRAWNERLGRLGRVISFDKRGTGLSERTLGLGTIEDRMDDIRAVMDAAGLQRAALLGVSEGGPLAIQFAATYPARVSALVLYGTFARFAIGPDHPEGVNVPETLEPFLAWVQQTWGSGEVLGGFVPCPDELGPVLARYERNSATPGAAAEALRRNAMMDVRGALGAISVPTLVLHNRGDRIVPRRLGRGLADGIEGARYVELDAEGHISAIPEDFDELFDVLGEFLTGGQVERPIERVLATVLFTDIVGSTRQAADVGDHRWHDLLDRHDAAVRREVERGRGRVVKTTGDGVLAVFAGPARAVRAAQAIDASTRAFGVRVRAGLHAGECEVRGEDVAGLTVHIAARVAALAGSGEVLVTGTVRDLVMGSDLTFEERGRHALAGVPGEWPLLSAR